MKIEELSQLQADFEMAKLICGVAAGFTRPPCTNQQLLNAFECLPANKVYCIELISQFLIAHKTGQPTAASELALIKLLNRSHEKHRAINKGSKHIFTGISFDELTSALVAVDFDNWSLAGACVEDE